MCYRFIGFLTIAVAYQFASAQSRPTTSSADPEETRLSVGTDAEYQSLLTDLALDAKTQLAIRSKIEQRKQRLTQFVEGERGQTLEALREELRQARLAKQGERVTALRSSIQPFSDEYWQLRQDTRREILTVLSDEQFAEYLALVLGQRVARSLPKVELTPKQLEATRALALEQIRPRASAQLLQADPYFRTLEPQLLGLRRQVVEQVLTPEQRSLLAPQKQRAPATAPSTQP